MNLRKAVIVLIAIIVGLLHVVIGPQYRGPFPVFVHGYLIDILLPLSMFLLAGLVRHPLLGKQVVRAVAIMAVGVCVETAQLVGLEIFGRTFDPLDYVAYAAGIVAGMLFEKFILDKLGTPGKPEKWEIP